MKHFLITASNAGDAEATFELGKLYLDEGKIEDGEKLIEKAAAENYTPAIMYLAKKKLKAGDYEKALQLYKIASRAER